MHSDPIETEQQQVPSSEPAVSAYEDSLEGMLQYHADLSAWFKHQSQVAKTTFKRDFYKKKQIKNNQKLWKLLVRTPNQFNPLLKYVQPQSPGKTGSEDPSHIGYMQVADENGEFPSSEQGTLTTTGEV